MSAPPIRAYVLTSHARFELARRGLTEAAVASVIAAPAQRWQLRPGRDVLQSQIGEPGKVYLVRVIVDVDRTPCAVVTAYRTSKIGKYWRKLP